MTAAAGPTARTRAANAPVLVMGAGAVGCWIGGCLQAAGAPVTFVGRPRVLGALRAHGLTLTDLEGGSRRVPAQALDLRESAAGAQRRRSCCCASRAAPQRPRPANSRVPCRPARWSCRCKTACPIRRGAGRGAGAERAPGHGAVQHRRTRARPLPPRHGRPRCAAAQDHALLRPWQAASRRAGVPLALHADLAPLQWGKLLLNLNNAVNALSGLPLRAQLLEREYRVCMAALIDEALAALRAAGIVPAKLTPLPPAALPTALRLPTALFRVLAARMLRIDAKARTSMADDLAHGRATEIDALCGEVVRLARRHGTAAPVNERISELVRAWPENPRARSGAELRATLGV